MRSHLTFSLSDFSSIFGPNKQVEAEEQEDIAESFTVEAVPSFVILRVCLILT